MKYLKDNRLFQSLAHNTFPKAVCLFLAIVTWFIVMENKNPVLETIYRDIPVELLGLEQVENRGLIIERKNGDAVDVTVSGKWQDIIKMNENAIRLSVSLDSISGKGTTKILIDRRITAATGVSILSLSKDSIELKVDAIETVKKPINMLIVGELPTDLELGTVVYKDEEIDVTGPSLLLKEIVFIQGEIDISPITSSSTELVNLRALDIDGQEVEGVELEMSSLLVSIPVIGMKRVPLEIVTEGEIRTNYRLTDKTANFSEVTIKGNTNLLGGINLVRTKPISIKNAERSFESMLELDLPKDIKLVENESLTAKFTIVALDNKRFNFIGKDVKLLNTDENYDYIVDPELILSLEVKDVRDVIKDIEESGIKLEIDVEGLSLGEYTLQISVKGIPESSHYSVSELPITIVLKGE